LEAVAASKKVRKRVESRKGENQVFSEKGRIYRRGEKPKENYHFGKENSILTNKKFSFS